MKDLQKIFDNCPAGAKVMTKGDRFVYVINNDNAQESNYRGLGYKLVPKPVKAPKEVKDVVKKTSTRSKS